jgi:hydroxymethylpyrimidine pyrophosphatase-like HAD family hydrolase
MMGNACEELLSCGWPVTRSNDENGVAAAIRHVLDGEPLEPRKPAEPQQVV